MIGAKELDDGYFNYYRKLTPHADSRFSMVAEHRDYFDIRGKIETQMLSPKTRYAAYLVYRLEKDFKDLQPVKGIIWFVNLDEYRDAERRATTLHLRPGLVGKSQQIAVSRPDGWMELQLGMFYNDLGSDGPVEAGLLKSDERSKVDLVIEGIEFRPAKTGFVSKENARNRRKGIFSKLRISG
ncbi:unnamed protein product [Fraxinus pennsylvanica]|uniref:Uncharacterized protein n=1 Tax=Fraxinus pennsylvanica TaxID=56036 RepID=A0AAD1ZUX7_9LAMI|nr:unnamed protein product [Fraxinus pennsylvanica]